MYINLIPFSVFCSITLYQILCTFYIAKNSVMIFSPTLFIIQPLYNHEGLNKSFFSYTYLGDYYEKIYSYIVISSPINISH